VGPELLAKVGPEQAAKINRQKIGLVLAFMHRPELLVLDEPTSGLDPLMQREFENLLQETAAEGRTVFLSPHELGEVQRSTHRIGIIREGRLVAEDTVEGLRQPRRRRWRSASAARSTRQS
jgi:beta-exotoxin I transport system ATP-binding protein